MYRHQNGSMICCFWTFLVILVACCISGCADDRHPYARFEPPAIQSSDTIDSVYVVVEIPAGTTALQALDTVQGAVVPIEGSAVDFLPYPGNFGFISRTLREGRPLQAMLLMHALAAESVVSAIPIGVLQMKHQGIPYDVIMCVPAGVELQSIRVTRFADFITDYNPARQILQEWFLNHLGFGSLELVGWQDERFAMEQIRQHRIPAE